MRLFLAADHGGFSLKEKLKKIPGIDWIDLGTFSEVSVDYPSFAQKMVEEIRKAGGDLRAQRGVLVCGSGVGMSIAANRFRGIRAVLAYRADVAKLSRQHNASNILCLGGRFLSEKEALEIFAAWRETDFEGGRHERRIEAMDQLEGK